MKEKCKHESGWLITDVLYLFVRPNNKVVISHKAYSESKKFKATCNNPVCSATRNIYIKAEVIKLGKIKNERASK